MADRQAAVDRNAGSYRKRFLSSSRRAELGKTPSVMGTVTVLPVRSSVIVMVSGTGETVVRFTKPRFVITRLVTAHVDCRSLR